MTAIVVVLPTVVGEITTIDGDTITVTQPGGTTATIHVDSDTTYRLAGGSGAGSLSDLKVGMVIVAEGTQRSDGSLDAPSVSGGSRRAPSAAPASVPSRASPTATGRPGRDALTGAVERRELIGRGDSPDGAAPGPGEPGAAFPFHVHLRHGRSMEMNERPSRPQHDRSFR